MEWRGALLSEYIPFPMETMEERTPAQPDVPWPQSVSEFEALINEMQHRLVQFAFCRLRSREDAEDAVQEVLVKAYRDREKHRAVVNAVPFLFRMVANRCTDVLRKRQREAGRLEDCAGELAASGKGALEAADDARRMRSIEESLERLPRRQSEAIRLRVYGELPFEAVAQAMGCSVPTVKSRFRYGIQKLRRVLTRLGGER